MMLTIRLAPGEQIAGRGDDAAIRLVGAEVSRRHCAIRVLDGRVEIEDLGSRAGTFLNGRRFERMELVAGDRVRIGPHTLRFDGIDLHSAPPGGRIVLEQAGFDAGGRAILDGIDLEIPDGAFCGLLGASGAGKSTLLRCAAGIVKPSRGRVFPGANAFCGFVPQDDIVHGQLTPREALECAARLRLRRGVPWSQVAKRVRDTLELVGLDDRMDVRIDRLSGGQRKRVSVAVELLARPDILFLDEPTSGLDPAAELRLMEILRELATSGCTVVCTTHIVENVYLMDRLALLDGGRLVCAGTPDQVRAMFGVERFTEIYRRLAARCTPAPPPVTQPPTTNPPLVAQTAEGSSTFSRSADDQALTKASLPPPPRGRGGGFSVVLRRMISLLKAEPRQAALLAAQPLLIAGLLGWATDDVALILFFAGITMAWFGCSNAAGEIVKELPVYLRERHSGLTREGYASAKLVGMTVIIIVQGLMLYAGCALSEGGLSGAAGWQLAALGAAGLGGTAIGLGISALASSPRQAVLAVPLVLIPQILLSGYTVPAHEMAADVRQVASLVPSYGVQQILDTSFLWGQPLVREVLSDFWTSFRNLNEAGDLKTGEVYLRIGPAVWGFLVHGMWVVLGLSAVWIGLGRREAASRSGRVEA